MKNEKVKKLLIVVARWILFIPIALLVNYIILGLFNHFSFNFLGDISNEVKIYGYLGGHIIRGSVYVYLTEFIKIYVFMIVVLVVAPSHKTIIFKIFKIILILTIIYSTGSMIFFIIKGYPMPFELSLSIIITQVAEILALISLSKSHKKIIENFNELIKI